MSPRYKAAFCARPRDDDFNPPIGTILARGKVQTPRSSSGMAFRRSEQAGEILAAAWRWTLASSAGCVHCEIMPARSVNELFTVRQRHAYLLRHIQKLSDRQAAVVMGYRGPRAAERFGRMAKRAERQFAFIRSTIERAGGDLGTLEEFISSESAADR